MRQPASAFGRRFLSTAVADAPLAKPAIKPASPNFSSGPCAKRPGYSLTGLADAPLGRSHRAKIGKSKLAGAITQTRELLEANGLPKDYHIGIVPASDTGAVEMAMWSLLGPKPVTVVHFESFGGEWYTDITKQLKLENVTNCQADYGVLPPLESVNWKTDDVVFTYNGTTAGVRCPPGWAPPADRAGLAICDATSAVFAMDMPWANLDVVTFSWQKCLGGEGAHGMLILSPRAVERIESYDPPWPLPKIFRMKKKGKLDAGIFEGATINTPSMLANEVSKRAAARQQHASSTTTPARSSSKKGGSCTHLFPALSLTHIAILLRYTGLPRRPRLGEEHRRLRGPRRPRERQPCGAREVRRCDAVDGVPRHRRDRALEHLRLPQDHRPRCRGRQEDGGDPREGGCRPRCRRVQIGAAGLPDLVRADR